MIEKVAFRIPQKPKAERVAAYARVSTANDAMHHSLVAQVNYYSDLIQNHPGWLFAGVYADEDFTGTRSDRDDFQRLLADCRSGKIDRIITKSVSRFARNTVTLLETVRELKTLGIDVYFEEQNIHTLSGNGELMLTILASFAQAESLSVSENQRWRVKRNFESGLPWNCTVFGYRFNGEQFVVVPKEAVTVKRIFHEYLTGKGALSIARGLNEDGILSRRGGEWYQNTIYKMLRNGIYTGNLLLQTYYCESYLSKKMVPNNGEKPMYRVDNAHEAIIDADTFMKVQDEIKRRTRPGHGKVVYPFSGLIRCGNCGKHYNRKTTAAGIVWICVTFNTKGKKACSSKQIPESVLYELTSDVDIAALDCIIAKNGNTLVFRFKDGTEDIRIWKDRSRSQSWTPEMKEAARQRALQQRREKKCQEP